MQRFLDSQCYVLCRGYDEIFDFYHLCKELEIPFSTRATFEQWLLDDKPNISTTVPYIFAFDWTGPGDGISYWSNHDHGDNKRPIVNFRDLAFDLLIGAPDTSDFLDLL